MSAAFSIAIHACSSLDESNLALTFTIITAVYNRADTVGQAVASVHSQTWPSVEHVVIDGASDDGTLEVLHAAGACIASLVSEPDKGIYDALNKGFRASTGDIVGLLHSDDAFADDDVLGRVVEAFDDPAIDGVYGDLDYVAKDDVSRVIRRWRSGEFDRRRLSLGWMPPHPTLFLRRSVIDQLGGYDTSYQIAADYDFILRYLGRDGIKLAYIPEVLVKMRVGGESNRSLSRIIRKSREDYRALRSNGVGGVGALIWKNLSKVKQFF